MTIRLLVGPALLLTLFACDRAPQAEPAGAVAHETKPQLTAEQQVLAGQMATIRSSPLSVIVRHRVRDFEKYREQFSTQSEVRRSAGVLGYLMSRPADDPHGVLVHFAAESKQKMDAFLSSPALETLLDGENAPASSLLWMAENVLVDLPPVPLSKSHSLYLKTAVKDFSKLQAGLAGAIATFRAEGLGMLALLRSTEDSGVAIVHLTARDRPSLEKIYASPAFQKALSESEASREAKPIFAEDIR